MRLELSPQDAAFREELRTFFTTAVPQEIRDAVAARRELTKDQIVESQRILNAAGLAVPGWPVEWGGRDWTPLPAAHLARGDAARVRAAAARVQRVDGRAGRRHLGSQEQKERFLPATANLDIWWSPGVLRARRGLRPRVAADPAVRDGDVVVINDQKTWTTIAQCDLDLPPRPHRPGRAQATAGHLVPDGRHPLAWRHGAPHRAHRRRPRHQRGLLRRDVPVPVHHLVGEENRGWDYAKTLLDNERVAIAPVGSIKRVLANTKGRHAATASRRHVAARRPALRGAHRRAGERAARPGAHCAPGRRTLHGPQPHAPRRPRCSS